MMKFILRTTLVFSIACFFVTQRVSAVTINFDVDASNAPINAPCLFSNAAGPLTTLYQSLGATFSGPAAGQGGAILDQCGNFGVNALSGTNFLAFNINAATQSGAAVGPETITFSTLVDSVSIFASGGGNAASFQIEAFNALNQSLGTASVNTLAGAYGQLAINAAGIDHVVLSRLSGNQFWLYDDLTFNPSDTRDIPAPAALFFLLMGAIGLRARKK